MLLVSLANRPIGEEQELFRSILNQPLALLPLKLQRRERVAR